MGRWQKNRDLSWYAKGDTSDAAISAAEARKEELRKIKEAEQDALSEALGYGPMPKRNANDTPLGKKEVEKAIKETAEGDDMEITKGVGFGAFDGPQGGMVDDGGEVLGGVGIDDRLKGARVERRRKDARKKSRSRDRHRDRRHRRSRSRHRSKDRRHGKYDDIGHDPLPRYRSREASREKHGHRKRRSRSYEKRRDERHYHEHRRDRSNSPDYRRREHYSRDRSYERRP